jgi:hypothetical protein
LESATFETELTNYGKGSLENVLVGVVVDGERKAQTTVSLPPGQPTRLRFSLKLDTPGDHGGYVEIDHDSYEPDNRRYFSLYIPQRINLVAVGQGGNIDPVRLALDRPEAGQIAYTGINAAELLREDLSKYDVILLDDIPSLDASRETAISRFVSGGGGLFVVLGKSADNSYWQKFLPTISGITPGALSGREGEYITWNNFDYENPIFSIYSPDAADRSKPSIPDIKVSYYHDLAGGRAIGSSGTGVDIMAESKDRPIVVFGSGLDLASSDLVAHSLFIPLLVRSVEYLGSRNGGGGANGIIGRTLQWRLPGNTAQGLSLRSPGGETEDLQPVLEGGGSMVRITEYGVPGIYTLATNDKTISLMAFNIDNIESENETVSANEFGERLGVEVKAIAPDSDLQTTILQARFGKELWKEFLILAMILLIAESIIGKTSPPKVEAK